MLGEHRYGLPNNHRDRVVGLPPDNKRGCYIIGSGVATFTENVEGQVKPDILKACERITEDWYREYN